MNSAGAQRLKAIELTQEEVRERLAARGLRVTVMTVSRWCRGLYKPDASARPVLRDVFGIRIDDWDREPAAKAPRPKPRTAATAAPRRAPEGEGEVEDVTTPPAAELAREQLNRIRQIRARFEGEDVGMAALERLSNMERKAIESYAKLSGQQATEREILSSPFFVSVVDEIVEALEGFPDALFAVRDALRRRTESGEAGR